jgi:Spy/CpxP family protein refolding chaperone
MKRLIALLILAAACALAQGPEMLPWWDGPMVQNLNLSADQQRQIRAAVSEFRDRLIEQRGTVQKAEGNLQDLMNEDQVNETRAREAIDKLVAARSELLRTVSQMTLKMRVVLTPEQWQTVQKRRAGQALQQRKQFRPKRP